MATTIELYQASIDQLVIYTANEPDKTKRDAAQAKITDYRLKIIDAAFDDIVKRTERLTTLMQDLRNVVNNASNVPSVAGALSGIRTIIGQIGGEVGPHM
jgi:hypothetical protein